MLLKNFAAGDGVASRDQEFVRPSADDLDCRLPDSPIRGVGDSPTHRYGESIFDDYEYLHEFEAKIETARKLVCGTYADLNYAKTSENSVHWHVPLIKFFWG